MPRRGSTVVETSEQAEADWQAEMQRMAMATKDFFEACTPGYYNNEGHISENGGLLSSVYGGGSEAFFTIIRELARHRHPRGTRDHLTRLTAHRSSRPSSTRRASPIATKDSRVRGCGEAMIGRPRVASDQVGGAGRHVGARSQRAQLNELDNFGYLLLALPTQPGLACTTPAGAQTSTGWLSPSVWHQQRRLDQDPRRAPKP